MHSTNLMATEQLDNFVLNWFILFFHVSIYFASTSKFIQVKKEGNLLHDFSASKSVNTWWNDFIHYLMHIVATPFTENTVPTLQKKGLKSEEHSFCKNEHEN